MAPLSMNEGSSAWIPSTPVIFVASLSISASLMLLIIFCGCCKKKDDGENVMAQKAPESKPPVSAKDAPEPKSKGSSRISTNAKSGKAGTEIKRPPSPPAAGESKLASEMKQPSLKKAESTAVPTPAPAFPSIPTPAPAPVSAPKASPIEKAPIAIKSLRTAPPPTPPEPKGETPPVLVEDAKSMPVATQQKTAMQSMITPKAGGAAPASGANVVPQSKGPLTTVQSDDPAYRSLVGLDEMFAATQVNAGGSMRGSAAKQSSGNAGSLPSASMSGLSAASGKQ